MRHELNLVISYYGNICKVIVSSQFHLRLNFSDMIDAWISWLSHTKGFDPNTNVLRATKIEKCKTEILNLLDLLICAI